MPRVAPPTIEPTEADMEEPSELLRVARVSWELKQISDTLKSMDLRQAKHEERLEQKFADIEKKMDEIPERYVSKKELAERLSPLNTALTKINENTAWIVRIIIGAVVLALLSLIIANRNGLGGM